MITPRAVLLQVVAIASAVASVSGRIAVNPNVGIVQCVCDAISSSVCGSDGKTYSSACVARCAGVDVAHDGDCKLVEDKYVCNTVWQPVCGSDGNTYSNDCNLGLATGVVKAYDGECTKPAEPQPVEPKPVEPVPQPEPYPEPTPPAPVPLPPAPVPPPPAPVPPAPVPCCGAGTSCCNGRCISGDLASSRSYSRFCKTTGSAACCSVSY